MSVVGLGRGGMSVLSPFSTQLWTLAGALGTAENANFGQRPTALMCSAQVRTNDHKQENDNKA
jgi:hypothetical protein